ASPTAVPGAPLYGLERGRENAALMLMRGDESRGLRYLELARTRLNEVRSLAGRPDQLGGALAAMDAETITGVRLLTTDGVGRLSDDPLASDASRPRQPCGR